MEPWTEYLMNQADATGGHYWGVGYAPEAGDVAGWRAWMQKNALPFAPDNVRDDPEFLHTLMAGAFGESSLNHKAVQPDGNGRGLWQFDTGKGAMGHGLSEDQLFDPLYQASRIVPEYAAAFARAPGGLAPAERASWVAGQAERPFGYDNPNSQARRNYASGYRQVLP